MRTTQEKEKLASKTQSHAESSKQALQTKSNPFVSNTAQMKSNPFIDATAQRKPNPFVREQASEAKENKTGLPDTLKTGIESLSGMDMGDVKVHYNSDKPAQLQALAYAQGSDIHVANGQEKHLPHEAWHVVQQKQGRVQPTAQLKGTQINDNTALEQEADKMGDKALSATPQNAMLSSVKSAQTPAQLVTQRRKIPDAILEEDISNKGGVWETIWGFFSGDSTTEIYRNLCHNFEIQPKGSVNEMIEQLKEAKAIDDEDVAKISELWKKKKGIQDEAPSSASDSVSAHA